MLPGVRGLPVRGGTWSRGFRGPLVRWLAGHKGAALWGFPAELLARRTTNASLNAGHAAILHACTIGDGSLVGMGATLCDGSVVCTPPYLKVAPSSSIWYAGKLRVGNLVPPYPGGDAVVIRGHPSPALGTGSA